MIDINFLRQQSLALSKQAQKDRKIFRVTVIATIVVIIISLGLIGLNAFLDTKTQSILADIDQSKKDIEAKKDTEIKYLFLIRKLEIIKELFSLRADKQAAINFFDDLFAEDVRISGIKYEIEEGILSLTITSPHIFRLEEVFDKLKDPEISKNFLTMNRSNLKRTENAEYSFSLIVTLDKDSELVSIEEDL